MSISIAKLPPKIRRSGKWYVWTREAAKTIEIEVQTLLAWLDRKYCIWIDRPLEVIELPKKLRRRAGFKRRYRYVLEKDVEQVKTAMGENMPRGQGKAGWLDKWQVRERFNYSLCKVKRLTSTGQDALNGKPVRMEHEQHFRNGTIRKTRIWNEADLNAVAAAEKAAKAALERKSTADLLSDREAVAEGIITRGQIAGGVRREELAVPQYKLVPLGDGRHRKLRSFRRDALTRQAARYARGPAAATQADRITEREAEALGLTGLRHYSKSRGGRAHPALDRCVEDWPVEADGRRAWYEFSRADCEKIIAWRQSRSLDVAKQFLIDNLPREAKELRALAQTKGIPGRTLKVAMIKLQVQVSYVGQVGRQKCYWHLAGQKLPAAEAAPRPARAKALTLVRSNPGLSLSALASKAAAKGIKPTTLRRAWEETIAPRATPSPVIPVDAVKPVAATVPQTPRKKIGRPKGKKDEEAEYRDKQILAAYLADKGKPANQRRSKQELADEFEVHRTHVSRLTCTVEREKNARQEKTVKPS